MTAPATPATDTQLDEQTIADLQPDCEMVTLLRLGTLVLNVADCDHPAQWILRARCGQTTTVVLSCDHHATGARTGTMPLLCRACRTVVPAADIHLERI